MFGLGSRCGMFVIVSCGDFCLERVKRSMSGY